MLAGLVGACGDAEPAAGSPTASDVYRVDVLKGDSPEEVTPVDPDPSDADVPSELPAPIDPVASNGYDAFKGTFCPRIATAYCHALTTCGCEDSGFDEAACIARIGAVDHCIDLTIGGTRAAVDGYLASGYAFSQRALDWCATELATRFDACTVPIWQNGLCHFYVAPPLVAVVGPGGACEPGAACADATGSCDAGGVCRAMPADGEACADTCTAGSVCAEGTCHPIATRGVGAACDKSTGYETCAPPLACNGAYCIDPRVGVVAGESCDSDASCGSDSLCLGKEVAAVCGQPLARGATCDHDSECGDGLYCEPWEYVCKERSTTRHAEREACDPYGGDNGGCADELACVSDSSGTATCIRPSKAGASCADTGVCEATDYCADDLVCHPRKTLGEGCDLPSMFVLESCASGLFCDAVSRTCARAPLVGEACDDRTPCARGVCPASGIVDGHCRPDACSALQSL